MLTDVDLDGNIFERYDSDCEDCGRSLVSRFGGRPGSICPSCDDDFARLWKAGKLRVLVNDEPLD